MPSSSHSETPLLQKLGIKPSMKLLLINAPEDYNKLVQVNLNSQLCRKNEVPDLTHLFVENINSFETQMKRLKPLYKKNTSMIIWVSWFKKSAKIPTDISEDNIRDYALANDLVDVKVCAVSEVWSGLKLVVPLVKR